MEERRKRVKDEFYYNLTDHEREKAISFLLQSLLKSQVGSLERGAEASGVDEDVNIYLAHLMFAVTTPQYRNVTERYLSPYVSDVDRMAGEADDSYIKYFIYKANADHLLLHLGIFQDLGDDAPRAHTIFHVNEKQFSGRATNYYDSAARFNQRIYHKQTAVGIVLGKLAEDFDRYRELLRVTRRDFFHFANVSTDESFAHFLKDMNRFEKTHTLKTLQDEFLDVYGAWLSNRTEELRTRLLKLAETMRSRDPDFKFQMPE